MEEERMADKILETFATCICQLQNLRAEDFNKIGGRTDYNYIALSADCYYQLYENISKNMDTAISPQEVSKVLRDLSGCHLKSHGYTITESRLVHSQEESEYRLRKVVDFGTDSKGMPAIAISVAFLKQRLTHLFPDTLIQ